MQPARTISAPWPARSVAAGSNATGPRRRTRRGNDRYRARSWRHPRFPQPDVRAAARPLAGAAAARPRDRGAAGLGARPQDEPALRRGLHGRPERRDGPRAALARLSRPTSAAPASDQLLGRAGVPNDGAGRTSTPLARLARPRAGRRGQRRRPSRERVRDAVAQRRCCAATRPRSSTPRRPSFRTESAGRARIRPSSVCRMFRGLDEP